MTFPLKEEDCKTFILPSITLKAGAIFPVCIIASKTNRNREKISIFALFTGSSAAYDVKIVITENTLKELPPDHQFLTRELDLVIAKGRREPVLTHELMS